MGTFVIYTLINSGKGFGKSRSKQHKQRTGEQLRSIWEQQLVSGPLFTNQRSYFMVRWTAHLRSNSLQRQNDWVASYQYNITCPSSHVLAIWCRNQWEWESTKFVVLCSQKTWYLLRKRRPGSTTTYGYVAHIFFPDSSKAIWNGGGKVLVCAFPTIYKPSKDIKECSLRIRNEDE